MNNNPFQPAGSEPPVFTPTDDSADNFMANSEMKNTAPKAARPAVTLDGVSPSLDMNFNVGTPVDTPEIPMAPIDAGVLSDALGNAEPNNNIDADATNPIPADSPNDLSISPDLLNDSAENPLDNIAAPTDNDSSAPSSNPVLDDIAAAADSADAAAANSSSAAPADPKPPKQFTISIATIILVVLAIAGIGGTIYFWLQNNNNLSALDEANAKIAQLEDNGAQTSTSDNKTSGQFDALQAKIAELTKTNDENAKTLDENKKQIDQLTKDKTDLTTKNEDLTKKVQNISDLTTKLDTMLNKLNKVFPDSGTTTNEES